MVLFDFIHIEIFQLYRYSIRIFIWIQICCTSNTYWYVLTIVRCSEFFHALEPLTLLAPFSMYLLFMLRWCLYQMNMKTWTICSITNIDDKTMSSMLKMLILSPLLNTTLLLQFPEESLSLFSSDELFPPILFTAVLFDSLDR